MNYVADVVTRGADPLLEFALVSHKTLPQVLQQTGRGATRYLLATTPPATAQGGPGTLDTSGEAKQRGYRTIKRDLARVFTPVRDRATLKSIQRHHRERYTGADIVAIHLRHLARKRPGAVMSRDRERPYYAGWKLLSTLENKLRSHVGRLAAGWMPAAAALGVRAPAWIARHGLGRGTYQADFGGDVMMLKSVNHASPHAPVEELRRRVGYAVRYAHNDLARQIPYIEAKIARQLGFGLGLAPSASTGDGALA